MSGCVRLAVKAERGACRCMFLDWVCSSRRECVTAAKTMHMAASCGCVPRSAIGESIGQATRRAICPLFDSLVVRLTPLGVSWEAEGQQQGQRQVCRHTLSATGCAHSMYESQGQHQGFCAFGLSIKSRLAGWEVCELVVFSRLSKCMCMCVDAQHRANWHSDTCALAMIRRCDRVSLACAPHNRQAAAAVAVSGCVLHRPPWE